MKSAFFNIIIAVFVLLLLSKKSLSLSRNNRNRARDPSRQIRQPRPRRQGAPGAARNSQHVLKTWASVLQPHDFNSTNWKMMFRTKMPQEYFASYSLRLSNLFQTLQVPLNFVLIGACDGTNDKTIRDLFIPNHHWNGMFVEPVSRNYKDLVKFMIDNNVTERSTTFQAAVTDVCSSPNVTFKASVREDFHPEYAHWLRRQIGKILPADEDPDALDRRKWALEAVPCATAADVMEAWTGLTPGSRR